VNIPSSSPLADYARVIQLFELDVVADDPLTLVSAGYTLIVEDKRHTAEKYGVLITIPGFVGVPLNKDALLATLGMSLNGGRFDARIADEKIDVNFVMGFSRPISPKEVLAVAATGDLFVSACREIVQKFGGSLYAHS